MRLARSAYGVSVASAIAASGVACKQSVISQAHNGEDNSGENEVARIAMAARRRKITSKKHHLQRISSSGAASGGIAAAASDILGVWHHGAQQA